jgi:sortase A
MTDPGGRRRLDLRTVGRRVGGTLMIVGALVLGFVAFQLWGTGIEHARAQRELRTEFERSLDDAQLVSQPESTVPAVTAMRPDVMTPGPMVTSGPPTTTAVSTESHPRRATTAPPTTAPPPTVPPQPVFAPGDPVARLEIPRIGVDEIVVSGVEVEDLKKGPGHYPQTPLPGQPGNAAIAGHRTTYGAPFFSIDELAPGDEIVATSFAGRFVYRVTDTTVVSPEEVGVIAGTADTRLTLTSCHPLYSASSRIVVTAQLDVAHSAPVATVPPPITATARPRPVPTTVAEKRVTTTTTTRSASPHRPGSATTTTSTTTVRTSVPPEPDSAAAIPLDDAFGGSGGGSAQPSEPTGPGEPTSTPAVPSLGSGWFDDTSALLDILLWGAAGIGIVLAIRWATRRVGHRVLLSALGLVPFVVALFFFYENLNRVLPAGV